MEIFTRGVEPQGFTPIDVVIRVTSQAELDALRALSGCSYTVPKDVVANSWTRREKADGPVLGGFISGLHKALEGC